MKNAYPYICSALLVAFIFIAVSFLTGCVWKGGLIAGWVVFVGVSFSMEDIARWRESRKRGNDSE